jgi:hypothetical protein
MTFLALAVALAYGIIAWACRVPNLAAWLARSRSV